MKYISLAAAFVCFFAASTTQSYAMALMGVFNLTIFVVRLTAEGGIE